jgi:hypothetical protein
MQMSLSLKKKWRARVTMVLPFTAFVFQKVKDTNHKNGKATAGLTNEDVAETALSIYIAGR